jgi:hypothetical protein
MQGGLFQHSPRSSWKEQRCRKEAAKPSKKWKYVVLTVERFECNYGTEFREYSTNGKHDFTLKFKKGKDKGFIRT